jgi:hypothetical protein
MTPFYTSVGPSEKSRKRNLFFCEKGWQRKRSVSLLKLLSLQNGILMGENE